MGSGFLHNTSLAYFYVIKYSPVIHLENKQCFKSYGLSSIIIQISSLYLVGCLDISSILPLTMIVIFIIIINIKKLIEVKYT